MTFQDILGSMAKGAVAAVDTPAFVALSQDKRAEKESERKDKRLEQELSLKEQQIKQAKIKTALQEDAQKAQRLGQKFSQTNQDPNVAAEMYNSMGYNNEMQFDQSHFESTASGGRRQAAPVDPTQAGQTEDRLKPAGERQGSLVGATDGEYRFKTGHFERNDKGEILKGEDGKPKFIETGEPVLFKTKQEMIDATMQTTMDPKLRLAMALKDLGIDEFIQKKGVSKAATKEIDVARHEQKTAEQKQSGETQVKVATIQAEGRVAAATGKGTGSMSASQKATQERMAADDFRKTFEEDVNKVLSPDEESPKQRFTRPQIKNIMSVEQDEDWDATFKKLKSLSARKQNIKLQRLAKLRKLPKDYIKYLKLKLNQ